MTKQTDPGNSCDPQREAAALRHGHHFDAGNRSGEHGARLVLLLTLVAMVVEITAGRWFNSIALEADGWHMSSHALGIGLSVFAYAAARRFAADPRFAFGSWKIEVLAGYTSALLLMGVAAMMVVESITRLLQPQPVRYVEAMIVAVAGLAVNLISAHLLHHDHEGHAHAHDLNLRAAYIHVLTDALTSLLAIAALCAGLWWNWVWLDPVMGLVGAALVSAWAVGLLRDSACILLDREMERPAAQSIRACLETALATYQETTLTDLHIWRVGRNSNAVVVSLLSHDPQLTPARLREDLRAHADIAHLSIEINPCPSHTVGSNGNKSSV